MRKKFGGNSGHQGASQSASGKEPTCPCRWHNRHGFRPWVGKIPWRRAWQPTPAFSPGEPHGQRSLTGQSQTWLKWFSTHTHSVGIERDFLEASMWRQACTECLPNASFTFPTTNLGFPGGTKSLCGVAESWTWLSTHACVHRHLRSSLIWTMASKTTSPNALRLFSPFIFRSHRVDNSSFPFLPQSITPTDFSTEATPTPRRFS